MEKVATTKPVENSIKGHLKSINLEIPIRIYERHPNIQNHYIINLSFTDNSFDGFISVTTPKEAIDYFEEFVNLFVFEGNGKSEYLEKEKLFLIDQIFNNRDLIVSITGLDTSHEIRSENLDNPQDKAVYDLVLSNIYSTKFEIIDVDKDIDIDRVPEEMCKYNFLLYSTFEENIPHIQETVNNIQAGDFF